MSTAAGVGSDEARKLHKAIDGCNAVIEKDAALLAQFTKLTFDINIVNNQTEELYKLTGPAITVIQDKKGVWSAIATMVTRTKGEISDRPTRMICWTQTWPN